MHKKVGILTILELLANTAKVYFYQANLLRKRVYHLQRLFCTVVFVVTESDLHQQEVQILSF